MSVNARIFARSRWRLPVFTTLLCVAMLVVAYGRVNETSASFIENALQEYLNAHLPNSELSLGTVRMSLSLSRFEFVVSGARFVSRDNDTEVFVPEATIEAIPILGEEASVRVTSVTLGRPVVTYTGKLGEGAHDILNVGDLVSGFGVMGTFLSKSIGEMNSGIEFVQVIEPVLQLPGQSPFSLPSVGLCKDGAAIATVKASYDVGVVSDKYCKSDDSLSPLFVGLNLENRGAAQHHVHGNQLNRSWVERYLSGVVGNNISVGDPPNISARASLRRISQIENSKLLFKLRFQQTEQDGALMSMYLNAAMLEDHLSFAGSVTPFDLYIASAKYKPQHGLSDLRAIATKRDDGLQYGLVVDERDATYHLRLTAAFDEYIARVRGTTPVAPLAEYLQSPIDIDYHSSVGKFKSNTVAYFDGQLEYSATKASLLSKHSTTRVGNSTGNLSFQLEPAAGRGAQFSVNAEFQALDWLDVRSSLLALGIEHAIMHRIKQGNLDKLDVDLSGSIGPEGIALAQRRLAGFEASEVIFDYGLEVGDVTVTGASVTGTIGNDILEVDFDGQAKLNFSDASLADSSALLPHGKLQYPYAAIVAGQHNFGAQQLTTPTLSVMARTHASELVPLIAATSGLTLSDMPNVTSGTIEVVASYEGDFDESLPDFIGATQFSVALEDGAIIFNKDLVMTNLRGGLIATGERVDGQISAMVNSEALKVETSTSRSQLANVLELNFSTGATLVNYMAGRRVAVDYFPQFGENILGRISWDYGKQVMIKADLSSGTINWNALGYRKASGAAATLAGAVSFSETIDIADITYKSNELELSGLLSLHHDAGETILEIDRFRFGELSVGSVSISSDAKRLAVNLNAESMHLEPILNFLAVAIDTSNQDDENSDIDLELAVKIGTLFGMNNKTYEDVDIDVLRRAAQFERFFIQAEKRSKPSIAGKLVRKENQEYLLDVVSFDAGHFLNFMGFYSRIVGGSLSFADELWSKDGTSIDGLLIMRDFVVNDEPMLSRLSQTDITNIDDNTVTAGPTHFDQLKFRYQRQGSFFRIKSSHAVGPTIGLTVDGHVDFGREELRLVGTYVPSYQLNTLISKIPGIGLFFGGEVDSGLLGISYKVEGGFEHPELRVNPLALLAPGIFRKAFEFDSQSDR